MICKIDFTYPKTLPILFTDKIDVYSFTGYVETGNIEELRRDFEAVMNNKYVNGEYLHLINICEVNKEELPKGMAVISTHHFINVELGGMMDLANQKNS